MAFQIRQFREEPHACSYLPDELASLDVRLLLSVTPGELGVLLDRGWRRFGPAYFRPACLACEACLPVRVRVDAFQPTSSHRRAARQSAPLDRIIQPPQVDAERLDLYARWHAHREAHRGWEPTALSADRYATEFAFPHPSVREVAFRDPARSGRLVGLGIVDIVPRGLSAVYFFWDPEHAPPSLGTAHIVRLIEHAREEGLPFVYLGYRVDACPSLAYKARYQPQEILSGRPADDEVPAWSLDTRRTGRFDTQGGGVPHTRRGGVRHATRRE